jgi:tetratricopeptide (TPR) repeat protein
MPRSHEAETGVDPEENTSVYRAQQGPAPGATEPAPTATPKPIKARDQAGGRPMFGQEEVVRRLQRALESAVPAAGTAQLVVVQGLAGAGKSSMLRCASEIAAELHRDVSVHYAALRSRDDGPYAPFSRLLLDSFGITPASSPSAVRRDMESAVADVLGSSERALDTAHLLGHLAGVPFPSSPLLRELERDPGGLHAQAVAALARFVAGLAERAPLLWLLDDMTDAEPSAWDLLEALLALPVRLALVMTGRPPIGERVAALSSKERVLQLDLLALTSENAAKLTQALVPDLRELPDEFLSALMHRSSGNPRQLVELVRALQDGGLFQRQEHGVIVDLGRLERGGLPLTMADSIRARVGTLPPIELQVMHDAAVIGERFWDGALLSLQRSREPPLDRTLPALAVWAPRDDELALQQALDALEAKGFIVRIADSPTPGLNEYTFQYAGTRSVVYTGLAQTELARGHAAVARWLALTTGLGVESLAALLAPQLEHAGARERAAHAYLQAASDERARMRTTMALLYVDKALALIDEADLAIRIEALHERGSLLTTLGRHSEALVAFDQIVRAAWTIGARGRGGAALNRIARIHRERGDHEQALEHLRAALLLFDCIGDQRGVASTYDDMAQVHRVQNQLDAALAAAKQALAIRVAGHDRRGQAVSLNTIGRIELDLGRYESAEGRFATALEIRSTLSDHEGALQTRIALGQLALRRGQSDAAIGIYRDVLEGAREMNHQRFQSYAQHYLGVALLAKGDLESAERSLRDARKLAAALRDQYSLVEIDRHLTALAQRRSSPEAKRD